MDDIPWSPQPGTGGFMLAFGLLLRLIHRGALSREDAFEILDEQMSVLEDMMQHPGTNGHAALLLSSGLRDLSFARQMLATHPSTKLPD